MLEFLTGCGSLFTAVFNAANSLDYFQLLFGLIAFHITLGLFTFMSRKMLRS